MPTYIRLMKMTDQGSKDLKNASAKIEEGMKLQQKMGGKVIGVYMVMGEYDFVTIGEFPSDEASAAFSLAISSRGDVKVMTLKAFPAKDIPAILNMLPKS